MRRHKSGPLALRIRYLLEAATDCTDIVHDNSTQNMAPQSHKLCSKCSTVTAVPSTKRKTVRTSRASKNVCKLDLCWERDDVMHEKDL